MRKLIAALTLASGITLVPSAALAAEAPDPRPTVTVIVPAQLPTVTVTQTPPTATVTQTAEPRQDPGKKDAVSSTWLLVLLCIGICAWVIGLCAL